VANPIDFAIEQGDVDPVTGGGVRKYVELEVGAAPVLIFVNKTGLNSGEFGDGNYTNVNKFGLANALLGNVTHVRDLSTVPGEGDYPLHVFIREPLSGTYNTTEFNSPNSAVIAGDLYQGVGRVTGQEAGINTALSNCPAKPCVAESGNPLFHIGGATAHGNATRARAIGSGEEVKSVNNTVDSLGYSFWNFSSFAAAKAGNTKYLSVDGVDPLFASYAPNNGAEPQCPATPCVLPFTNIINGSYPIWSKYRVIYNAFDSTQIVTNLVTLSQGISSTLISDFIPAPSLAVFRSHFPQVVTTGGGGIGPNNGFRPGIPETGGDMGGAVLTVQSELDFIADTGGNQQVSLKQ
jgi:hypothetical protein